MGGARILIVEDDPCVRELLYLHLSGAGYEVLVAEDAMIGGRFLLDQRIDLLIADINMPCMDGLDLVQARQEACRALRLSGRN